MSDIVELLRRWKTTESMRRSTDSLIVEAADEIERLVDELATTIIGLQAERALADDLAAVLTRFDVVPRQPEVYRVLARYREARGR